MATHPARAALQVVLAAAADGRLDRICEDYGVVVMSAFGSAAGSRKPDPDDLDIAVRFERSIGPELRRDTAHLRRRSLELMARANGDT